MNEILWNIIISLARFNLILFAFDIVWRSAIFLFDLFKKYIDAKMK